MASHDCAVELRLPASTTEKLQTIAYKHSHGSWRLVWPKVKRFLKSKQCHSQVNIKWSRGKENNWSLAISPLLLLVVFISYSFFWFCKLKSLLRNHHNQGWLITYDLTSLPPTVQNEVKVILSLACHGGQWSKSRKLGQACFKASAICFSKHNYLFVSNTILFHT